VAKKLKEGQGGAFRGVKRGSQVKEYTFFKIPSGELDQNSEVMFKDPTSKCAVKFSNLILKGFKVHSFECASGTFWALLEK